MIRLSRLALATLVPVLSITAAGRCKASDHLDSPTVIADPRADIGDIYAWTSPDHRRLNLVMTIVGHTFSDKVAYVFHVDSGPKFGSTAATTSIVCRFSVTQEADCHHGTDDAERDHGRGLGPQPPHGIGDEAAHAASLTRGSSHAYSRSTMSPSTMSRVE